MKFSLRTLFIATSITLGLLSTGCNNNFTVEDVPTPFKITNLKGGNSELYVTWPRVANATDYTIFYRPLGSKTWNTQTATKPPALITGLTNGLEYEVRVEANNNKGTSISDVRVGKPTARTIAYLEQTSAAHLNVTTSGTFNGDPLVYEKFIVTGQMSPPTTTADNQLDTPTIDAELTQSGNYRVFMNFSGIYKSEDIRALYRN